MIKKESTLQDSCLRIIKVMQRAKETICLTGLTNKDKG